MSFTPGPLHQSGAKVLEYIRPLAAAGTAGAAKMTAARPPPPITAAAPALECVIGGE